MAKKKKRPKPRERSRRTRVVREARYLATGHDDQALTDHDRAIELDPDQDEFAAARTEICQQAGSSDTHDALPNNPQPSPGSRLGGGLRGYRRLGLLRLRLAFQIASAVPRTASAATLHRIRSAGPVTETAPIG
jgi:hypothetical protein